MFDAVKLKKKKKKKKKTGPDKYKYSGYGLGFDTCGNFSLPDPSGFGKNVIISGADMHVDNKKNKSLIQLMV